MGIRSATQYSGLVVNGVTLGEPAEHDNGTLEWDGGVPNGDMDDTMMFTPDGEDTETAPLPTLVSVTATLWTQPEGAHDAYPSDAIVEHHGGFWSSMQDANVFEPPTSWRRVGDDPNEIFPWYQPVGAHDAYRLGAVVTHNGSTWDNTGSDANVWEPGVFGWEVRVP